MEASPLVVTRDESLLEAVLRLCAAAGVVPEVVADPRAALRGWAAAPIVLLGADLVDDVGRLAPTRRSSVFVLCRGPVPHGTFAGAVTVGAEQVVELPRSESWVVERLSDLEVSLGGSVVAVIGGSGGAGASTLACAVGQAAAREGPTLIVDADPLGPGLERVVGYELLEGIGWDALLQTTGRISGAALRDAVPRRRSLGLLGWGAGRPGPLAPFAVREALASARRGHAVVVVDLPRRVDAVAEEVLARCDRVLLVVTGTVGGLASAARVSGRLGVERPVWLVCRRPGVEPADVGRLLRRPVAAELGHQRGLEEAVDLGLGPLRSTRGPLGRAVSSVLDILPPARAGAGRRVRPTAPPDAASGAPKVPGDSLAGDSQPDGSRPDGSRPDGSRPDDFRPDDFTAGDSVAALVALVRSRLARDVGSAPTPRRVAEALREEGRPVGDATVLAVHDALCRDVLGAGPLEPLLRLPGVTDVLVNGPDHVLLDRGGGLEVTGVRFADDLAVRRLAQRLAAQGGRRLDDASPFVDVRLGDGTRFHAVLAPLARPGTCLSLRVPRARVFTLDELVAAGTVTVDGARLLRQVVEGRLAFLVTGGTGSGKTTLLNSLLSLADPGHRLVLVEDASELRPDHPHVVALEARPPNVEDQGRVTVRDLVRQALRMRPDRLVVGEVRGAELVDLLAALNTGHEGGCGTLHANSAADVPARVEGLALASGLGREAAHSQLASALHVVLHVARDRDGRRRLVEVGVPTQRPDGLVEIASAVRFSSDGRSRLGAERAVSRLETLLGRAP